MCFKSPADQKIGYVPGGLTPNEVVQQHSTGDLLPNSLPVGGTDEARPSSLPQTLPNPEGIAPQIQNGRTGCSGFMTLAIETSHRETKLADLGFCSGEHWFQNAAALPSAGALLIRSMLATSDSRML